jgi:hypothetical protein
MRPLRPRLSATILVSASTSDNSIAQTTGGYGTIQLISGHESKKSLEIYQHHSLGVGELAYQEAVQGVSI